MALQSLSPGRAPERVTTPRGVDTRFLLLFPVLTTPRCSLFPTSILNAEPCPRPPINPFPGRFLSCLRWASNFRSRHVLWEQEFLMQDIELDAANGKQLGKFFVREGKSKNARRHVSLSPDSRDARQPIAGEQIGLCLRKLCWQNRISLLHLITFTRSCGAICSCRRTA